jgi:cell division protein ZipA
MSELRWILLAAAILVVAYVYWRGRRDQRRVERSGDARIEPVVRAADLTLDAPAAGRREPQLGQIDELVDEGARLIEPAPVAWPADAPMRPVSATRSERTGGRRSLEEAARTSPPADDNGRAPDAAARKIVALRIARRGGERIPGTLLLDVLHREGLQFGDYRIFHRYAEPAGGSRIPLFSVANMAEPGELDPDRIEDLDVAGIAMFMVLPGPKAGASALVEMLGAARRVASGLSAELLDEHGSTMTRQTADHMRDEIVEFEHRHRTEHQAGVLADR